MFVNAFYSTIVFSIESQKIFAYETVLEGPIDKQHRSIQVIIICARLIKRTREEP
jgi:hypothetical protein